MPEQDSHIDYTALISRYLSGNTTDVEVRQLEAWVLADQDNKAQFVAFKKVWMLSGMEKKTQLPDIDQLWEQVSVQLVEKPKLRTLRKAKYRRRRLQIAAAAALLLAASIWLFQNLNQDNTLLVSTTDAIKSFDLPDGSRLTLNQSSSATYTHMPGGSLRQVYLQGDAFFEVARDENRPFVILTAGLEIEVLGTSFYVDARTEQPEVQVIVQTGSVAVRSDSPAPIILQAAEKAVYQKAEGILSAQPNEDLNFLSIKTNTLIFENSSLAEVIFALERQYDVTVDNNIEAPVNCLLDGTYPDYSLDDILVFLKETWKIEVERRGKNIVLSGMACE